MRSAAQRLIRQPARLVDADAREIVVELRDVTAVDVWALRELVAVGRKASGAGATAAVACEDEGVARLLRILGPGTDLEIEQSVPAAFAQVARRASGLRSLPVSPAPA